MQIVQTLHQNTGVLPHRQAAAKASADLMTTILNQSAEAAFRCASQVMVQNKIIIPAEDIQDDMMERAAIQHVKRYHESSSHAPFLQGMREKGRIGTVVSNPVTGALIDTRAYGGRRARHREQNNRLKRDGASEVLKPPSLFPFGSEKESVADKRKRNASRPYFGPGENAVVDCCLQDDTGADASAADGAPTFFSEVTPQRLQRGVDLTMSDVTTTTDDMLSRVTHRAFVDSGVVQQVLNVDSGEVEMNPKKQKRGSRELYLSMVKEKETARDIVGNVLKMRPGTTSIEALGVVENFMTSDLKW